MDANNSNPTDPQSTYHYTLPLQTTKFAIFGLLSSGQLASQAISVAAELNIALKKNRTDCNNRSLCRT